MSRLQFFTFGKSLLRCSFLSCIRMDKSCKVVICSSSVEIVSHRFTVLVSVFVQQSDCSPCTLVFPATIQYSSKNPQSSNQDTLSVIISILQSNQLVDECRSHYFRSLATPFAIICFKLTDCLFWVGGAKHEYQARYWGMMFNSWLP